jgi:Uma2 family endonuclease
MSAQLAYRLVTAQEFLDMDFGFDKKAELDRGVIQMMAGGTAAHALVQANLLAALRNALRGSGCRPYGSDMGLLIGEHSLRYPDVAVYCGDSNAVENGKQTAFVAPRLVIEVLSEGTAAFDQDVKFSEYKGIASVEGIVFVNPDDERIRIVSRDRSGGWLDTGFSSTAGLCVPTLGLDIAHAEIFSRD